jgi:hypothetical protein
MRLTVAHRWGQATARKDARPAAERPDGQILVLFSLALVALIGFAAVAVDLGSYLKVRRDYQNAADAAALAGAPFLTTSTPDRLSARHAAWTSLQAQLGVTILGSPWTSDTGAASPVNDTTNKYSLWVSTPPINSGAKYPGAYTGSADKAVFVWIEAQNPSYLSRIFGINGSFVSAWATAGIFPNRYAVITLRQPTQDGPSQEDVRLAGSNVSLTVIDGDVGGNWNMKLNSNNNLVLPGDSQVYLHDYVSCGPACWNPAQVNNGSTPKNVFQLPGPVPDPNYPLPPSVVTAPTAPTSALPYGFTPAFPSVDKKSGPGVVKVGSGGDNPAVTSVTTVAGVQTCNTATAVRIGPGYYSDIEVDGGYCLLLDPSYVHDCLSVGAGCADTPTAVPSTQMPGVFYLDGTVTIKGGGMLVGDGVTIVIRPKDEPNDNGQFSAGGGAGSPGVIDLNATKLSGAWTRRGVSPYVSVTTGCLYGATSCWQYTNTYEADLTQTGMALYVMRRDQIPGSGAASDDWTQVIQINASAGLAWNGITYAPHDSSTLAGQPGHSGVGQLVSWTFTVNGGTNVTQTYSGPFSGIPLLLEPRLGQT